MLAADFVNKLYEACEARKLEQFEISYGCRENNSLLVFEQEVTNSANNEAQTVSLRVKVGTKIGTSSCDELIEDNINYMIEKAVASAQLIDCEDENFFHDGSGDYQKVEYKEPLMDRLESMDKVEVLKELERKAYAADKRINKVISVGMGYGSGSFIMRNSLGLNLSDAGKSASIHISLSAKDGETVKTGFWKTDLAEEKDFDFDALVKTAVEKALSKLNPVNIKSQVTDVIFDGEAFADLLATSAGMFSADAVQKKYSKLAGKLGKKVAADKLTIIDNPLLPRGYSSYSFDIEGYPASYKELITDGILNTFLHNLKTAHKDKVKPTGNGNSSGIRFSNFYVKAGHLSVDEMFKKIGNGVLITELNGLHAGFNLASGDFSFGALGFLIENGKKTKALNQFTIAGNIYQLLLDVEEVGNDLKFVFSNFGSPSILVKNISIANE